MNKLIGKIVLTLALVTSSFVSAHCGCKKWEDNSSLVFSIDFRKPEYVLSRDAVINHDEGTEFNPTCGKSWKLDRYNSETGEFSYLEIELNVDKEEATDYALEIFACSRKDNPLKAKVSISVNDQLIDEGYNTYSGPDSIHFPDRKGKPSHLRWDVFDITAAVRQGNNKIRISLDKDTQSGISMSWLHIRSTPKS